MKQRTGWTKSRSLRLTLGLAVYCIASYAISEADVKTAYILNFAKFVEWPAQQKLKDSTLNLCVANPDVLDGKLLQLNGRQASGMLIHVSSVQLIQDWKECQIIFFRAEDIEHAPLLLKAIGKNPILTISDAPDFAVHGGIIGFSLENNRINFSVNLKTAETAGLHLSSRMLQVAHVVYSESH